MLNPPQDDRPADSRGRRTAAAALLGLVVVAAVAVVAVVVTRGGEGTPAAAGPVGSTGSSAVPSVTGSATATSASTSAAPATRCTFPVGGTAARPVTPPTQLSPPETGTVDGTLTTSAGPIPFTLDRAEAPCTIDSLVSLASQSFYDKVPCHRLTTAEVYLLQCGDPTGTGRGGPGYTVPDELPPASTTTYPRGTMAMANQGTPNSGGSQFFLVYQDSPLPPSYTVFGRVSAAGLKTLDAIAAAGTSGGSPDGAPKTPVTILALSGINS